MGVIIPVDLDRTVFDDTQRKINAVHAATGRWIDRATAQRYSIRQLDMEPEEFKVCNNLYNGPEFLSADELYFGADIALDEIRERGIAITYLTGRHREGDQSQESGTLESLRKYELPFPDGEYVFLFLKPTRSETTGGHKTHVLSHGIPQLGFTKGPGIGDTPEDATVYVSHGFRPALIRRTDRVDEQKFAQMPDTLVFYDWIQILEWVEQNVEVD